MSGTPVPIYVRKKKTNDSAGPKFFKSSATKKEKKESKKTAKHKVKDGNRSSASSDQPPLSIPSRSSTSGEHLWPAGAPIEPPVDIPPPKYSEVTPSPTAASSTTVLLPPPLDSPLPPPPRQLRRVPPNPALTENVRPAVVNYQHEQGGIANETVPTRPPPNFARTLNAKPDPHSNQGVSSSNNEVLVTPKGYEVFPRPLKQRSVSDSGPRPMDHVYTVAPPTSTGQLNPTATYHHIQDMSAKRVSTLDYLRKT
jgi:hypothetical protein